MTHGREEPAMSREEKLRDYFERYARTALGPEPETLADFYDASFLAAGPKGGAAFTNDESFLAWLREVHAFNARSGMTSMAVDGVGETPISDAWVLVTVEWAATFRRTGDTPIRFSISYLLRTSGESPKVAAYISHEDQEDAMRAHGLL
jgi:hypothetical protein